MSAEKPTPKKPARLQHVVAHKIQIVAASGGPAGGGIGGGSSGGAGGSFPNAYDEVLVFGQKLDALEYCHGKPGWVYAAIPHGAQFTEALKAATS